MDLGETDPLHQPPGDGPPSSSPTLPPPPPPPSEPCEPSPMDAPDAAPSTSMDIASAEDDEVSRSPSLDFLSPSFDPLRALHTPDLQPPVPAVRPLDNVAQCRKLLPPELPGALPLERNQTSEEARKKHMRFKESAVRLRERILGGTSHSLDRVLAAAAEASPGPLDTLRRWHALAARVCVTTRHACGVRGHATGVLTAYDRFMNLVLRDVDERYTVPVRRVKEYKKLVPAAEAASGGRVGCGSSESTLPQSDEAGMVEVTCTRVVRRREVRQRQLGQIFVKGDNVVAVHLAREGAEQLHQEQQPEVGGMAGAGLSALPVRGPAVIGATSAAGLATQPPRRPGHSRLPDLPEGRGPTQAQVSKHVPASAASGPAPAAPAGAPLGGSGSGMERTGSAPAGGRRRASPGGAVQALLPPGPPPPPLPPAAAVPVAPLHSYYPYQHPQPYQYQQPYVYQEPYQYPYPQFQHQQHPLEAQQGPWPGGALATQAGGPLPAAAGGVAGAVGHLMQQPGRPPSAPPPPRHLPPPPPPPPPEGWAPGEHMGRH